MTKYHVLLTYNFGDTKPALYTSFNDRLKKAMQGTSPEKIDELGTVWTFKIPLKTQKEACNLVKEAVMDAISEVNKEASPDKITLNDIALQGSINPVIRK